MSALLAAAVVLLQAGSLTWAQAGGALAAAQASSRPRECAPAGAGGPNVWDTAREPNLRRYCDLLARGVAQLGLAPQAARETALLAADIAPGHAAPAVLEARADVALGAFDQALVAFERARTADSRTLEEPGALHDWATALRRTGKAAEALAAYRALAPRVGLLAGADKRVRALLEAADLAMSTGPSGLDDAVAFLRAAREVPLREARPRVLAMLALAIDRRGATDETAGLLAELSRAGGAVGIAAWRAAEGAEAADADAALALAGETDDPAAALRAWDAYLAGPSGKGAWSEHARRRAEALRKRATSEPRAPGRRSKT